MTQKVLKVGSSAMITLPKKSLKELGIGIGDEVRVEVDTKKKRVIVEATSQVDQELMDWTKKFIERYRPALEALAKK